MLFRSGTIELVTDLGLSNSYQVIMENHTGNLFRRSEFGHSAAFHIELPPLLFLDRNEICLTE